MRRWATASCRPRRPRRLARLSTRPWATASYPLLLRRPRLHRSRLACRNTPRWGIATCPPRLRLRPQPRLRLLRRPRPVCPSTPRWDIAPRRPRRRPRPRLSLHPRQPRLVCLSTRPWVIALCRPPRRPGLLTPMPAMRWVRRCLLRRLLLRLPVRCRAQLTPRTRSMDARRWQRRGRCFGRSTARSRPTR